MMLIEQTTVPSAALPVHELKDHLQLGRGFADDGSQDAVVESYLRAGIAAIEGRIGKALMTRTYFWSVTRWRDDDGQAMPVAPVQAITSVTLVAEDGAEVPLPASAYRLVKDNQRPKLAAVGVALPAVPLNGTAEIVFDAGFGPAWGDVPADLRQAVFLLAAQYYELRHEAVPGEGAMPFGVMALIERWRTVRLLGGRA